MSLLDFQGNNNSSEGSADGSRSTRSGSVTRVPFSPVREDEERFWEIPPTPKASDKHKEEEEDEEMATAPNSSGSMDSEHRAPPTPERLSCLMICEPGAGAAIADASAAGAKTTSAGTTVTPPRVNRRSVREVDVGDTSGLDEFGLSPTNTGLTATAEEAGRIKRLSRQLREQQTRARDLAQSNPITSQSREPSFFQRIFCGLF